MSLRTTLMSVGLLLAGVLSAPALVSYAPARLTPPEPTREFRGMWIASVGESSWVTNHSAADQQAALLAILKRAAYLKMNAVLFQVRPACDALYDSKLEPWSEYLTGTMGQAPQPYYDPLAFVVKEAHERGLQVHAWFNPYRALHFTSRSTIATNHVSRTHPELVRKYGRYLWLDPGERDVQDHTLRVVMDVVKRYDIDGVVFDDYFYPYPEQGRDFPDDASWKKFGARSGLSRDDWRRENVNALVERTYNSIKAVKPWVQFGISPFGIWRPGNPPQIKGLDAYAQLYADARKWLANGWLDYCVPQLYWPGNQKEQSFPVLLRWWAQQNVKGRHLWPGLNTYKVNEGWPVEEILQQIAAARKLPGVDGQVHWNSKPLMDNRRLVEILPHEDYVSPALIPASPWLGTNAFQRPTLSVSGDEAGDLHFGWSAAPGDKPWAWVLQIKIGDNWFMEVLQETERHWEGMAPDEVAVTPVDRNGLLGPSAGLVKKPPIFPPSTGRPPGTEPKPARGHSHKHGG